MTTPHTPASAGQAGWPALLSPARLRCGGQRRKTGEDFVKPGTGIAHTVEHLWDSIF
jgi:hypothetical protein